MRSFKKIFEVNENERNCVLLGANILYFLILNRDQNSQNSPERMRPLLGRTENFPPAETKIKASNIFTL